MLSKWNVMALKMGELTVERSTLTYFRDFGQSVAIPMWSTAVWNEEHRILIDTGVHDAGWVDFNLGPCVQDTDEDLTAALRKGLGWSPEDVDIVINTHLHYDHCGNNKLFTNARFIVQRREWIAAHSPIPSQKDIYVSELYDSVDYFSWIFVEDEAEVVPGIKVFLTPGHSDGHQSVLINTQEGKLCVSGDVSNLLVNIRENIPAGILTSTKDIYESMDRVRRLADYILPGHEPSIRKYQTSGFPTIH